MRQQRHQQCKGTTRAGVRCRRYAVAGTLLCLAHKLHPTDALPSLGRR